MSQNTQTDQIQSNSNFFALLIGIDYYLPNKLPNGYYYKSLGGCVGDINNVESFLKNTLQLPQAQIIKLIASNSENSFQPQEPQEQLPTYENIVTQFKQLTDLAQPNDQVYIHYSGHGGRATTIYPEVKGNNGLDESLVPTDIGNSEARYLRDLELAKLLQDMVDKGLVVTVVLDSCHSGGATRGEITNADVRGLPGNVVDTTPRPQQSLVASIPELLQNWKNLTKGQENTRNITASGWLPEPKGYVLLAACRDNESAYEYAFDGKTRNGALTYWLLDSLQKLESGVTYKVLCDRILAKVNSQFARQTPMLQGEGSRFLFSGHSMSSQSAAIVKKVDVAKNQVLLQAGDAQGVRQGAEFAIYQLGTTDFSHQKRVALARVVKVGAEESVAEIIKILHAGNPGNNLRLYIPANQTPKLTEGIIEDGAPALLLSPGVKLVRKVRLLPPLENQQLSKDIYSIKDKIEGHGWVEFLSSDQASEEPISYQLSVNGNEYEILDAGGELINLPPVAVNEANAAVTIINRLVHLSKYQTVVQLDNNDPMSSLAGKLKIDLCQPGENRHELRPLNAPGNVPILDADEYAILRIHNDFSEVLNITALAIQSDWSITQIYPQGASAFETLDPGMDMLVRIHTSLAEGCVESADILKVFATVEGTNFRWLELPKIDKPRQTRQVSRTNNPLEELLAAVASTQPPNRDISAAAYPSDKWTTEQIKLVVSFRA